MSRPTLPLPTATWLLTWNPEKVDWGDFQSDLAQLASGAEVGGRWSVGVSKKPRRGDRFYLLRQGLEPRGIFASGRLTSDVNPDEHWLDPSRQALYADISVDELLDPDASTILLKAELERRFPGVNWTPQASGQSIPSDVTAELELAWQEHLLAQSIALRPVVTAAQLEETLASFDSALKARSEAVRFAISHVERWLIDRRTRQMAPAKWAGFRGMTPVTYAALQRLQNQRNGARGFDGQRARHAIEKVVGGEFRPNEDLNRELRERFHRAFGPESASGGDLGSLSWMEVDVSGSSREEADTVGGDDGPMLPSEQNLVLYGPPGTGKTWETAWRAVEVCDGEAPDDREALMERYRELCEAGRIELVTFHQSFSYEDFVEGIRPVIEAGQAEQGGVRYELRDGIFKKLCAAASRRLAQGAGAAEVDLGATVWKMSVGRAGVEDDLYDEAIEQGIVSMGWGDPIDFSGCDDLPAIRARLEQAETREPDWATAAGFVQRFKNELAEGDLVIVSHGLRQVRAIGRVAGPYAYRPTLRHSQTRPVEWLAVFETPQPVELVSRKQLSQQTLYRMSRADLNLDGLRELLRRPETPGEEPYVLIIDEINRGNISKILGELITLLEPDKRLGQVNELKVRLPYSGQPFGVPSNLFVIGTMNSADRSIALLDTALRRRFGFEEIRPNPRVIRDLVGEGGVVDGVDVAGLLEVMNQRIELLLGRDHALGHAFFLQVTSLDDLVDVFRDAVLPLLREYFYENDERICQVLGCPSDGNGKQKNPVPLLVGERLDPQALLGSSDDVEARTRYRVSEELRRGGPRLAELFGGVATGGG